MTIPQGRVAVLDRAGWTKEYTLQKAIIHIGSDPRSDIVLEPGRGAGVAPRHAQLIAVSSSGEYRLVNLADGDIRLGPDNSQVLPPLSSMSLVSGQQLTLGDFTLIFYGEQATLAETTVGSRNIGLKISLPQAQLAPNRTLQGLITVSNQGERTGAQFYLELEGLDPECYRIEPGPVLSSGAEKEVVFQLQHHGHLPLAGEYELVIRAAAPGAYPAEQASATQLIQVLPFYRHKMTLLGPDGAAMSPQKPPLPGVEPAVPAPAAPAQPATAWSAVESPAEVEEQRVLKLKADQPPPAAEQPAAAGPEPAPETEPAELAQKPATTEDWWAAETAARPASASASWWEPRPATPRRVEEERVLKLKTVPLPDPAVESPPAPAPARNDVWDIPSTAPAAPESEPLAPLAEPAAPEPEVGPGPAAARPDVVTVPDQVEFSGPEVPEPPALRPEPAGQPDTESSINAAGTEPAAPEPQPRLAESEAPELVPARESPAAVAAVVPEPEPPVEVEAAAPVEPELRLEPAAAEPETQESAPAGETVALEPEPPVEVEAAAPVEPVPSLPVLEPLPSPEAAPVEVGEWALPPAEVPPVEPAAEDKSPEPAVPPAPEERPRQETGDWWLGEAAETALDKTTAGARPDLPRPALKLKAEETRPVEIELPTRTGRPRQGTEEWWIDAVPEESAGSGPASRPRPALKLKAASTPAEEQPEESSPTAEDWWSPAGDSST